MNTNNQRPFSRYRVSASPFVAAASKNRDLDVTANLHLVEPLTVNRRAVYNLRT